MNERSLDRPDRRSASLEEAARGSLPWRLERATWQVWQADRVGAQAKGESGLDFGRGGGY